MKTSGHIKHASCVWACLHSFLGTRLAANQGLSGWGAVATRPGLADPIQHVEQGTDRVEHPVQVIGPVDEQ